MIMISMVCYFMSTGVILIKDACVCAIMASFIYVLAAMAQGLRKGEILIIAACLLLAALIRPNLLPLMALGFVFFIKGASRRTLVLAMVSILVALSLYMANRHLGTAPELFGENAAPKFRSIRVRTGSDRIMPFLAITALSPYGVCCFVCRCRWLCSS